MLAVLVTCVVCAPLIGRYHGLYGYLVRVWSLLAPPVFVCVVAGIFTRRASNRGAIATLTTGIALGAAAFVVLDRPAWTQALPVYLQSSLNVGFVITVVCALVMALASGGTRGSGVPRLERHAVMSPAERRVYRAVLAAVVVLIVIVTLAFSPWGLAPSGSPG
jgi:Na+/proline symporter